MIIIGCYMPVLWMRCEAKSGIEQLTFGPVGEIEPNVSPDGRWLAFQYFEKNRPGSVQIWIMDLSRGFGEARRLANQFDYAGEISWSPDSKWISFISQTGNRTPLTNQIYRVNIVTNETVQITNFPEGTVIGDSTTWSINGFIGFEKHGVIYGIPYSGGKEILLLDPRTALSNNHPSSLRFSPDGTMLVLSVENAQQDQSSIWLADLKTHSVRQLTNLHFDLSPAWIDEKHILFTRQSKNKWSEVKVLSLLTTSLDQITSRHVDFTPYTDPSGKMLYFSRKGQSPKNLEQNDFFSGYHIWRMPMTHRLAQ
jgi:Tol biopolymer transport system component